MRQSRPIYRLSYGRQTTPGSLSLRPRLMGWSPVRLPNGKDRDRSELRPGASPQVAGANRGTG
jgi:hypothetical protein